MKANKVQRYLCDVIQVQQDFWKNSNDITSPTHLNDIEEECFAQLDDLISDEDIEEFQDKVNGCKAKDIASSCCARNLL